MAEVQRVEFVTEVIDNATQQIRGITRTIQEMTGQVQKTTRQTQNFTKKGGLLSDQTVMTTKTLTSSIRRFKAEYLSVMFLGMAVNRVFGGLLKTQTELWGINDLFAATLTVVLAPAMELLLTFLLPVLDWFMNLPEPVQKAIGLFVMFAAVVGGLATALGVLVLGFDGVMAVLAGLGIKFGVAGGTVTSLTGIWQGFVAVVAGLGATFLVVGAIVTLVLIGMYDAWNTNFLGMKYIVSDWIASIRQGFNGLWNYFKGIFTALWGILTGDLDKFIEGIKMALGGLWDFITAGFKVAMDMAGMVFVGAMDIMIRSLDIFLNIIKTAINLVSKLFGMGGDTANMSVKGDKVVSRQYGGIVPGSIGDAVPIIAHGGERVIPANRSGGGMGSGVQVNATYNVIVSDRKEFESMLRANNTKLVEDVRRLVEVNG